MTTQLIERPTEQRQPLSIVGAMATKFGMEPQAFEAALRATVVPQNCSNAQFAAFLLMAKKYDLDPVTKQIYAFPSKGGGITPIVGIDGWLHLANSHPNFNGMDFKDHVEGGKLVAITCRVYRKDREHPMECTEYMEECRRNTDPWNKSPGRMLRHRAAIQAIRYAFSFSGIVDEDEFGRIEDEPKQPVRAGFKLADAPLQIKAQPAVTTPQDEPVVDPTPTPAPEQEPPSEPLAAEKDPLKARRVLIGRRWLIQNPKLRGEKDDQIAARFLKWMNREAVREDRPIAETGEAVAVETLEKCEMELSNIETSA